MPSIAAAAISGDPVRPGADAPGLLGETASWTPSRASGCGFGPTGTPSAGVSALFRGGGAPGTALPGAGNPGVSAVLVSPSVIAVVRR